MLVYEGMTDRITEVSESDACTSYPITRRVWEGRTAFQDVVIADSPVYNRMLFLDGELQSASADEQIYHSSLVHPIMGRAPAGARVLVVGGGEGATVREVLRWNPSAVDWVDIDGELVALCEEHLKWAPGVRSDPRVHYSAADIRDWWPRVGSARYDVIILDLPDPDGDTGYLYSPDFWRDVNTYLRDNGMFVTHVGPVRPYGGVGEGARRILEGTAAADIDLTRQGFYHTCIPSFQGEWGFWLYNMSGYDTYCGVLRGERVADGAQLAAWTCPSQIWSDAVDQLCKQVSIDAAKLEKKMEDSEFGTK